MKRGLDFQEAAPKVKPNKWVIRKCSICCYPCSYVFNNDYTKVGYDSGCDCVGYENVTARSWDDLAKHYNNQDNPDVIKEMNEFWGFNNDNENGI